MLFCLRESCGLLTLVFGALIPVRKHWLSYPTIVFSVTDCQWVCHGVNFKPCAMYASNPISMRRVAYVVICKSV